MAIAAQHNIVFSSTFVALIRNQGYKKVPMMPDDNAKIKVIRPFTPPINVGLPSSNAIKWFKKYNNRISVEIGCGAGLHPIQWALKNPNGGLLAIERTKNKFKAFERRITGHDLSNIYAVNQDALHWLPQNLQNMTVNEYFFLYPNPYPKEKQANKRWHRNPMFHFILKSLKPNGLIHFASNSQNYLNECEFYCRSFWKLDLIKKTIVTSPPYTDFKTHFEKKYLLSGQTCTHLTYKKSKPSKGD